MMFLIVKNDVLNAFDTTKLKKIINYEDYCSYYPNITTVCSLKDFLCKL